MADKLAVIQSEETIKELENIKTRTEALVGTFKELVVESDKVNSGLLKGTPKEYVEAVAKAAELNKKHAETIRETARAKTELEKIQARISKAMTDEGKAVASARVQLTELNKENREAAKTSLGLSNAYDQLNRQHAASRKAAQDAAATHGLLSREFIQAAAEANKYDQQLKRIDASLGQFGRNVGNYPGGNMFGLNAQMAQVMREMPNFAMDARIGIMSLTNNLPYLADAIADVNNQSKIMKAEFKAASIAAREKAVADAIAAGASEKHAIAEGKKAEALVMSNYQAAKAPSIWRQLAMSIFSWQTLLVVGITLLMQYNEEITDFIGRLFGADESLKSVNERFRDNKEAVQEMTSELSKNIISLFDLKNNYDKLGDSLSAKKKFIDENKDAFNALGIEVNTVNDAEAVLVNGTQSVVQAMYLRAKASAYAKVAEKQLDDYLQKEMELEEYYETVNTRSPRNAKELGRSAKKLYYQATGYDPVAELNALQAKLEETKKAENELLKTAKDLEESAGVTTYSKGGEAARKKADAARKKSEREAAAAARKQESERKKREREAEAAERERLRLQKEAYDIEKDNIERLYQVRLEGIKNNIELAKDDPYSSESEKLTNQINYYNELIKVNAEYYDSLIANAKKYNQSTTDIEKARDVAIGNVETARNSTALKTPEALRKDLEYSQRIDDYARSAGNEETKRAILANVRLSQKEREYQLDLLEQKINLENLEIESKRIEERKQELMLRAQSGLLTRDEKTEWAQISEDAEKTANAIIEVKRVIDQTEFNRIAEEFAPVVDFISQGFDDLGLSNISNQFRTMYDKLLKEGKLFHMSNEEIWKAGMAVVTDFSNQLIQKQTEQRIAALDAQLESSRSATEQEIAFINSRLHMLNSLSDATKEQIEERNALEDEARTLREQQMQREKMIEAQKAKAQQRASAQQALINGILAATTTLATLGIPAGVIPAAIAAAMGVAMAGLIMSKDPVPKYFVGRKDGPAEMAWTQERGAEMITDRHGNIKTLGHDKGAVLTKLEAGDKVFTASETEKMMSEMGNISLGDNVFRKIARQSISPVFIKDSAVDIDALAAKVGDRFDMTFRKYDKAAVYELNGYQYMERNGRVPQVVGRVKKDKIVVINKDKNVRY